MRRRLKIYILITQLSGHKIEHVTVKNFSSVNWALESEYCSAPFLIIELVIEPVRVRVHAYTGAKNNNNNNKYYYYVICLHLYTAEFDEFRSRYRSLPVVVGARRCSIRFAVCDFLLAIYSDLRHRF